MSILKHEKRVEIVLSETREPLKYYPPFWNRSDTIHMCQSFWDPIVSDWKAINAGARFAVDIHKVVKTKYFNDQEVEAELPTDNFFEEREAVAIIAEIIEKQRQGDDEVTEGNHRHFLLFLKRMVVKITYHPNGHQLSGWHLSATWRDRNYEPGYYRVIVRAQVAL